MSYVIRDWFRPQQVGQVRREFDRVVDEFFGPAQAAWQRFGVAGFPSLNIWEESDVLYAEAELPGVKQEDLDLTVVGNQLTLKGRRAPAAPETGTYHRRERAVGEFSRTVVLPYEVDADKVEASLVDGVLNLTLPKSAAAKPRKINVNQSVSVNPAVNEAEQQS
ncbi:MAG: molecular chaperone Hsp20 [Pirellula sp.]|nr:molecular chaperone Hsp20 [Pirellula sp.]